MILRNGMSQAVSINCSNPFTRIVLQIVFGFSLRRKVKEISFGNRIVIPIASYQKLLKPYNFPILIASLCTTSTLADLGGA